MVQVEGFQLQEKEMLANNAWRPASTIVYANGGTRENEAKYLCGPPSPNNPHLSHDSSSASVYTKPTVAFIFLLLRIII